MSKNKKRDVGLRSYYGMLYITPYLYEPEMLSRYFKKAESEEEISAIKNHMVRHGVFDRPDLSGFRDVTSLIQEHQFEEYPISWEDLQEQYDPWVTWDGIRLKARSKGRKSIISDYADEEEYY